MSGGRDDRRAVRAGGGVARVGRARPRPPLALLGLRQSHPVRRRRHPPHRRVLASRPRRQPDGRGVVRPRVRRSVGDVPVVRPRRRRHHDRPRGRPGRRSARGVGMTAAPEQVALPGAVRARLAAIAARALDAMPAAQIRVRLRKGASFTQARRVKLLGPHLVEAVESDADFRGHVAAQARALEPATAHALASAHPIAEADIAAAAAVAFLIRGDGWRDVVAAAEAAESSAQASEASGAAAEAVDRMASALDAARAEAKAARQRQRTQVDELKAANTQLRHTLADTRRELRDALDAAERANADARESAHATRSLEAEARRLRARIAELEADSSAARRAGRDDRDAEVMRLRLLLDTMVDAVAGIRRELALPPSELLPADTVEAVEPAADSLAVGAGKAMPGDDPALLRRLIDLPRAHLIID